MMSVGSLGGHMGCMGEVRGEAWPGHMGCMGGPCGTHAEVEWEDVCLWAVCVIGVQ